MRIAQKTVTEQMDSADRIAATANGLELREQLAAEKARSDALEKNELLVSDLAKAQKLRADKAEKELAHALDMGSQADVCCGLLRTRAERARELLRQVVDEDHPDLADGEVCTLAKVKQAFAALKEGE